MNFFSTIETIDISRPLPKSRRPVGQYLDRRIEDVRYRRPGQKSGRPAEQAPIAQGLFDSAAFLKVTINQVAMHLGKEWRDKIFRQLDSLLDHEEWDDRDPPPAQTSSRTFVRLLLLISPQRKPGVAASNVGTLVATWIRDGGRLTMECLANDRVRWVLSRKMGDGETERAAGETTISRLPEVLKPYNPEIWFSGAE